MRLDSRAKLASLYGGFVWGTFWVPLRFLDDAGISGFWAVALLYGVGALLVLPLVGWRWRRLLANGWRQQLTGAILGIALALYGAAFLFTEVANAVLLFYLSPVWGFLLGRLVLADPITPLRWLAMTLALSGAAIVLGGESWPPLPSNPGDWMALASGLLFVIGSLMMLRWTQVPALDYALSFLVWSGLVILVLALIVEEGVPAMALVWGELPWLVPFLLIVLLPGSFAALYGASILNPGIVGILYMSEIGVAILLAAIFTDEPFGARQGIGILLIAIAGAAEGIFDVLRKRQLGKRDVSV
ncbi:MAG: DMT family transporter [Rhodospirillales bacterium]